MACEGCARILLIVVNIIFFLIGLGLTAGGVILRFFPSVYEDVLDDLQAQIPDFSSAIGIDGITTPSSAAEAVDLGSIFSSMGIGMLVFGLFVLIIAALGLFGACCKVKILLIVYVICVLVVLLAKVALFIVLLTGHFDNEIKDEITKVIDNDYAGITSFTAKSLSLNYVMLKFECCGLNDYNDFNTSTQWDRTWDVTYSNVTVSRTMVIPAACCQIDGTFPTSFTPKDANCTFVPTDDNSNWKTGCWDTLKDEYQTQKNTIIGVFVAVIVFEALCALCGILILCKKDEGTVV